MTRKKEVRTKWLTVRLSEDEEKKLLQYSGRTTARSLSEYSRDVLLKAPVTVYYRNQSADDFLAEMIQLKKELNAIGHNFNQVVHRLHTLHTIAELKSWLLLNEKHKALFLQKVDTISEKLSQIHVAWWQK